MIKPVYLSGPIHDCTDSEMYIWRMTATDLLYPIPVFDPTTQHFVDPIEIIRQDKVAILSSSVCLVMFSKPSVGTSMEVLFAYQNDIPVFVVYPNGSKDIPIWLEFHSNKTFDHLGMACKTIKALLEQ